MTKIFKRNSIKKLYDKDGNIFAEFSYHKEYFTNYSKHSHDTYCLNILDDGEIEFDIYQEENQSLCLNKVIVLNPNQVHQSKPITIKPLGHYVLYINKQWFKNIYEEDIIFNFSIENKNIYENLKRIFKIILKENHISYNKELEDLTIDIIKKYSTIKSDENEEKQSNFLYEIEKYILDNIDEQISLKDLSIKAGYTESYITRVFKKRFGLTPHAFIVNTKVNKAKNKLLQFDNISIAELSNEVGFYDQSHLNKVFKRIYAVSPNKYISKR